jgi:hypothetical protein
MPQYRIYTVGGDGKFSGAKNVECANDQEAIQKAQQRVNGSDVELWEHGRFIMRFPHDGPQA